MKKPALLLLLTAVCLVASTADAARKRAVGHPAPVFVAAHTEGGYADRASVAPGEEISFHIATSVNPFTLSIVSLNDRTRALTNVHQLTSRAQNCSGRFRGCGWDRTTTVRIPRSWPSGYYAARFPTAFGDRYAFFVVRPAQPASESRVLVVSPTLTYQAYNRFGGASFYYDHLGQEEHRASYVSYDRPYDDSAGLGRFDYWESGFSDWMRQEGRPFEVVADVDLDDPTLLSRYNLVVLVGHAEYWTSQARQNLETFHRNGGHIAVLGGNSMWWQVRLEDNGRTIVGFKQRALFDPLRATDRDELTSTHWYGSPVNMPENLLFGTSFRNGGYANKVPEPDRYELVPLEQRKGWTVTEDDHWVYEGTGMSRGETFGKATVGLEVDGAIFNCDANGNVRVDGSDGAPSNYHILAVTPASYGSGTLGIWTNANGGTVFNAATQNWTWGMFSDPVVKRMTQNVLNRLGNGARQQYDGVDSPILAEERFNCDPQLSALTVPGWDASFSRPQVTSACAFEGPRGLELRGPQAVELYRNIAPSGEPISEAHVRFHVNVEHYQRRFDYAVPLVTLRHTVGKVTSQPVLVEFDIVNGSKAVRIARRNAAGQYFASPWTTIGNGWHLIELEWRSPGDIVLSVDGNRAQTMQNPDTGQIVNEVFIEYYKAEIQETGHVCLDALAVATQRLGAVQPFH